MTDLIGQTIGQYVVLEEIGRGGMATVYRAFQLKIGRDVAIKVLPAAFTHDQTFLARFSREVELAARLQHTRILPVYDYGEYEGQPYIVSAYMPGGNLEERIAEEALPLDEVVRLVSQIAEGLDYLHGEGVIHRDFKPSNVLLDAAGSAFLSDFGIARVQEATAQLTGTGMIGTPAYMAPELFSTGDATPASDIYALGVTLYAMLAGVQPFDAETPAQHMRAHLEKPVPDIRRIRPDLPPGVQMVIATALAKDPAMRYPSAGALAAALRRVVYPAPSVRASTQQRLPVWPLAVMGGLVVLGIVVVAVFFALRGGTAAQPEPTAPVVVAAVTNTVAPTEIPSSMATPTLTPEPIPVIGGGTGRIGFNWNGLGYTVNASCVLAGGNSAGCDPNPNILPVFSGITPYFGQWSPDGKKILFVRSPDGTPSTGASGHTYLVDMENNRLVQVDPERGSYNPVFSPDATRLAYLSPGSTINLVDLDCGSQSGEVCTIVGAPVFDYGSSYDHYINLIQGWLPDDRLIVRNPELADSIGNAGFGLYTMSLDGASFEYYANQAGVSLGGNRVLSTESTSDLREIIFRVTDIESSTSAAILRIPDTRDKWAVSPDGRWLAYIQSNERLDPGEIMLVDLSACMGQGYLGCQNTGVQVTFNQTGEDALTFSPDSQWLAFIRGGRTEVREAVERAEYDYSGDPDNPIRTEIKSNFLFNVEGDIYLLNIQEALDSFGADTARQITPLRFATFIHWTYDDLTDLYWQPAPGN